MVTPMNMGTTTGTEAQRRAVPGDRTHAPACARSERAGRQLEVHRREVAADPLIERG